MAKKDNKKEKKEDKKSSSKSVHARKQRIIEARGSFKWLPVLCRSDLIHAAYWFTWASLLTAIIPIYPLVSLYYEFWPTSDYLPLAVHAAVYLLLIFSGMCYLIGSAAFIRAVDEVFIIRI